MDEQVSRTGFYTTYHQYCNRRGMLYPSYQLISRFSTTYSILQGFFHMSALLSLELRGWCRCWILILFTVSSCHDPLQPPSPSTIYSCKSEGLFKACIHVVHTYFVIINLYITTLFWFWWWGGSKDGVVDMFSWLTWPIEALFIEGQCKMYQQGVFLLIFRTSNLSRLCSGGSLMTGLTLNTICTNSFH